MKINIQVVLGYWDYFLSGFTNKINDVFLFWSID